MTWARRINTFLHGNSKISLLPWTATKIKFSNGTCKQASLAKKCLLSLLKFLKTSNRSNVLVTVNSQSFEVNKKPLIIVNQSTIKVCYRTLSFTATGKFHLRMVSRTRHSSNTAYKKIISQNKFPTSKHYRRSITLLWLSVFQKMVRWK